MVKDLPASWETQVPSLLQRTPQAPEQQSLWATTTGGRALQQEKPAPHHCRADPTLCNWRKARGQEHGLSMAKKSPQTNAGESVGDRNPLPHGGGKVSWCSRCAEQDGGCSENYRRRPHGPAVPLPGTDPDRTVTRKDIHVHPCAHSSRVYTNQDMETT